MRTARRHALLPALLAALAVSSCKQAEVPLPPAPAAEAGPAGPLRVPPQDGAFEQRAAICNIESINGISGEALEQPVPVSGEGLVSGWRALVTSDGSLAGAWLRVRAGDGTIAFQAPLPAVEERPDVEALTGQPVTRRSGFRNVAIRDLPAGTSTLEIVLDAGDAWVRCAHVRTVVAE